MAELPAPTLALEGVVNPVPERAAGDPLTLRMEPGQCWGVLGPNGAGKTTLLHTLAGLREPTAGTIRLDGSTLAELGRRRVARTLALVFQHHQDGFPATVLETALIGRHPYLGIWDIEGEAEQTLARAALAAVDMAGYERRLVSTLSGGERQRLAIATALTQDPAIFLMDEPTNHLDLHHQVAVFRILAERVAAGASAVLCLHDLNQAIRHCSHLLLLYPDGRACWGPTTEMLVPSALETLYDQPLVAGEVGGQPVFLPAFENK
ncbi:MAG: ABC transporter ATP-binding protein [Pseudomonadota bacterium]